MSKLSWFNSFISSLCLFLVLSFSTSALLSANSSMRFVDGRLGILAQPIGENIAWLGNKIKQGIIPFESISVQAQQAVNVVFSIEEALNQLITSIVQGILNTILALITQVINKLKDGIRQISGVFDKLKEMGAGFINALQSLSAVKDLFPQISSAAAKIFPTAGPLQNAVFTGLNNSAACDSIRKNQLILPANERSDVPAQETCDNLKINTAKVVEKAKCGEPTVPLVELLGVLNSCSLETNSTVKNEAEKLGNDAANNATKKIDNLISKAPPNCKFAINKENTIFQGFNPAASGSGPISTLFGQPNTTSGNYDFNNATFSFAKGESGLGIPDVQLVVPGPKECDLYTRGDLTTAAAALAADKSVPNVKDGGLQSVFDAFLKNVQAIVDNFVNDMVKFAQNLLNQFINVISSVAGGVPVLGQYLSSITGNLRSASDALKAASLK